MTLANAIIQGILLGGLLALFAAGLSLLFGVMGVLNLAHGDIAVVAGYLAVALVPALHLPTLWVFLIVVAVLMLCGYLVQRLIFQPSLESGPLTPLLVTLGMSVVIENLLLEIFTANSHSLSIGTFTGGALRVNSQISLSYLSLAILGAAVLSLAAIQLGLSRTKVGRIVRAVADDRDAAQLVGVNYRHIFGLAAAVAFGTVALAGLSLTMYTSISPTAGPTYLIYGFEAVVIGGLGSLWGTLAGGVVLGIAVTVGLLINSDFGALAPHLVFLAVLAVRPQGFFPRRVTA
ncbi:MAG TPA: branched-chain amino acid ABC transporter permease [Candidatus Acidoferrales bacterium]|nr:branched-chain amino acid ABC transporter permease [Candidatus Acidoferrales bacterium]